MAFIEPTQIQVLPLSPHEDEEEILPATQNQFIPTLPVPKHHTTIAANNATATKTLERPSQAQEQQVMIDTCVEELRRYWIDGMTVDPTLPSHFPSHISSLDGTASKAIEYTNAWERGFHRGDALAALKIVILNGMVQAAAEALFGPKDAEKLVDLPLTAQTWSLALVKSLESLGIPASMQTTQQQQQQHPPTAWAFFSAMTFVEEGGCDDDDNSHDSVEVDDEELCFKEEVEQRKGMIQRAEAEGQAWSIGPIAATTTATTSSSNKGTAFTEEEYVAMLKRIVKDGPQELDIDPTCAAPVQSVSMSMSPGGTEAQGVDVLRRAADVLRFASAAELLETVPTADGPHELQVGLTMPSCGNKEGKKDSSNRGGVPTGWMVGGWGPQQSNGHNVSPDGESNGDGGGGGGGDGAGNRGGSQERSGVPGDNQDTPSGLWYRRSDSKGVDGVSDERHRGGGGGGGVGVGGVRMTMAVETASAIPETQCHEMRESHQSIPLAHSSVVHTSAPPPPPFVGDVEHEGEEEEEAIPTGPSFQLVLPSGPHNVIVPSLPSSLNLGAGSQPVGSQDVAHAMRVTGALAQDLNLNETCMSSDVLGNGGGGMLQGTAAKTMPAFRTTTTKAPTRGKGQREEARIPPPKPTAVALASAKQGKSISPNKKDNGGGGGTKAEALRRTRGAGGVEKKSATGATTTAAKRTKRREYVGRVMSTVGARPDLGGVGPRLLVKNAAAAGAGAVAVNDNGHHHPAGNKQHQDDERMPVLFSGLQDTADCVEMRESEGNMRQARRPLPSHPNPNPAAVGVPLHYATTRRTSPRKPHPVLPGAEKPTRGRKNSTSPAKKPLPLKSLGCAANVPPPRFASPSSDPFKFPSDVRTEKGSSPKRLPRQQQNQRQPPPQHAPRAPYQPAPIRETREGLLLMRRPSFIIQTAPDMASLEHQQEEEEQRLWHGGGGGGVAQRRKRKSAGQALPQEEVTPKRQRRGNDAAASRKQGGGVTEEQSLEGVHDSEEQTIKEHWLSTARKRKHHQEQQEQEEKQEEAGSPTSRRLRRSSVEAARKTEKESGGKGTLRGRKKLTPLPPPQVLAATGAAAAVPLPLSSPRRSGRVAAAQTKNAQTGVRTRRNTTVASTAATKNGKKEVPAKKLAALDKHRATTKTAPPPAAAAPLSPRARFTRTAQGENRTGAIDKTKPVLENMTFLVSQGRGGTNANTNDDPMPPRACRKNGKSSIENLITSLGGTVLDAIPPPGRQRQKHAIDVVVADRMSDTPNSIYAAIKGIPIVTPAWVRKCTAQKALPPLTQSSSNDTLVLLPRAGIPPPPAFKNVHVFLYSGTGTSKGTEARSVELVKLLQHAGAHVVQVTRVTKIPGQLTCDVLLIDDGVSSQVRKQQTEIARERGIEVVRDRAWAVKTMLGREENDDDEDDEEEKDGEEEEEPALTSPPRPRPNRRQQATAATPTTKKFTARGDDDTTIAGVGDPIPELTSEFRKYYNTVRIGRKKTITTGAHVELAPLPGETLPRVARVSSLWAEKRATGEERYYGKFIRFFRPQETPLGLSFMGLRLPCVFQSLMTEQLPLAAVLKTVRVEYPTSADAGGLRGEGGVDYVCMLKYDYENVTLTSVINA